ncbi:hypothetical protein BLNAU_15649 [Blattamonas nauphoetae]|uniref:Uncharacterized protein n=1 Tax=Blattamonas nauphoetae TaxID=2049346 RepID=A0ABQ9XAG2_9EUKA|nr:hypothetical protein BLNAU_15649 [Blattamonas nauphoetae]
MWNKYSAQNSQTPKAGVRYGNETLPDERYDREQRRIATLRQRQEQVSQQRRVENWGSPEQQRALQTQRMNEMKQTAEAHRTIHQTEKQKERALEQTVIEADNRERISRIEQRDRMKERSRQYDEDNKLLMQQRKQMKMEQKMRDNSEPIVSDSFYDKFGCSYR